MRYDIVIGETVIGGIYRMYGYIRPYYPDLRVREYELYRAYYCGLCRQMGRYTGQLSRLTLSYDMTFFAIIRSVATSEKIEVDLGTCLVHPMKKRAVLLPTEQTKFASCASAVFIREKLTDSVNDDGFFKKTLSSLLIPSANHMKNRAEKYYGGLHESVCADLAKLSELENSKCESLDEAAGAFGDCLGHILAWGTDGTVNRILTSVGRAVGRFVYVIDAADDAAKDAKSGSYNPLGIAYGSDLCEQREVFDRKGRKITKAVLRPEIAENVMLSSNILLSELASATELLDLDSHRAGEIVRNIITKGMNGEMITVLGLAKEPTKNIVGFDR